LENVLTVVAIALEARPTDLMCIGDYGKSCYNGFFKFEKSKHINGSQLIDFYPILKKLKVGHGTVDV